MAIAASALVGALPFRRLPPQTLHRNFSPSAAPSRNS